MEGELTLEEMFQKLEEMLGILENRDTPLEDAFRTYERAMGIVRNCYAQIDRLEKKMLVLNEEGELIEFQE